MRLSSGCCVERQVVDMRAVLGIILFLRPHLFRQALDILEVLRVGDEGVLQTHKRDDRFLVARGEVLSAIRNKHHVAGGHKHRAQ